MSAYTVILFILMMHINWAFSVHDDKHIERVLYYIYSIWDNKAYVCVFVSVFSALTIPWNRLEIGVLLELSSYLDRVWCDFCTWGNSRLKCLPFVSNVISKTKVNPRRQPENFTLLFGQQWIILYAESGIHHCCRGHCDETVESFKK